MAYVHTAAHRTASAGADVDNARLVISNSRMIRPPAEYVLEGLGEVAVPAAATNWGAIVGDLAKAVLPAVAQVGVGIYAARQAKKDASRMEDLAREESKRAQATQIQIAQAQAQAAQAQAQAAQAAPGALASIPGGMTTLIVGGVVVIGLLAIVLMSRRGPAPTTAPATPAVAK
jgi:hypothetical protein